MKKKNEEYYITLAEKLVKAGVITVEQLSTIVSEVNVKYGFKSLSNPNSIYVTVNNLSKVFGDDFEIQKIEATGKDGRKVKNNIYNLKQVNRGRIYGHFKVSPKRLFNSESITPQDLEYRNAYLKKAKEEMAKNPNLKQEDAVRSAQRSIQRLTKEMIEKVWEIIPNFEIGKSLNLPEKDIKYLQKNNVIDTLFWYGVDLGFKIVSKRTIIFKRSMPEVAKEIINLARKVLKITLTMPVIEKKQEIVLTGNEAYIVLIVGGLIMKNDGKFIEIHSITSALRNNHYRSIELSGCQIEGIIKKVPHLFQKTANKISMVGDRHQTWKKIQEQYSPYNQEWIIPWCINSDIKLEDIQNMFPNSYQERDDIKTGSRIIIIKTDRSIRSFMSLAKLSEKFRDIDFPIGESNLIDKLNREVAYLDSSLFNLLLGKVDPMEWRGNSDKLLLQIEEGYI